MTLPIIPTLCTVISLIFASLTWISSKNRKQYNDPKVQDFFQRHRACGDKVYLYATSKLCNDQLTTDSTMSAEYVLLDKDEQVPNEKDRWKWMRRWLGDIDLRLYWSIMGICFLVCLIISIFIKPLQPLQSFQPTLTAISDGRFYLWKHIGIFLLREVARGIPHNFLLTGRICLYIIIKPPCNDSHRAAFICSR